MGGRADVVKSASPAPATQDVSTGARHTRRTPKQDDVECFFKTGVRDDALDLAKSSTSVDAEPPYEIHNTEKSRADFSFRARNNADTLDFSMKKSRAWIRALGVCGWECRKIHWLRKSSHG